MPNWTRTYAAIEGVPYDLRVAEYRNNLVKYARPVDEMVSRARVLLGDCWD